MAQIVFEEQVIFNRRKPNLSLSLQLNEEKSILGSSDWKIHETDGRLIWGLKIGQKLIQKTKRAEEILCKI